MTCVVGIATHCLDLRSIKLMECMNISPHAIRSMLGCCRQLNVVDLSFCSRWDNTLPREVFEVLPPNLTALTLCGIQTNISTTDCIQYLANLNQLTTLDMSGLGILNDEFLHSLLKRMGSRLIYLDLSGSFEKISDQGLEAVGEFCTRLKFLGLNVQRNLNCRGLLALLEDDNRAVLLETLRMANCVSVDTTVLESIASRCTNLHSLDISGIENGGMNDEVLCRLAETCGANLHTVFLRGNRTISDSSICELASQCPNLHVVSLSGIPTITDRAVLALADHCHYLKEVYLSGCMMISQAAINYLQDVSIDRVTVYHVVPNTTNTAIVIAKNLDTGEYCRVDY